MFGKKEGKKNAAPDGLSLAPGVSVLETEKGTVLFDGRQGRYFQLNELGLIVVRSLEEGKDADAIVRRVVEVYDVDAKTADADVRAFLAQIKELGVAAGRPRRAASIAREIFRNSSSGLCARHQKN